MHKMNFVKNLLVFENGGVTALLSSSSWNISVQLRCRSLTHFCKVWLPWVLFEDALLFSIYYLHNWCVQDLKELRYTKSKIRYRVIWPDKQVMRCEKLFYLRLWGSRFMSIFKNIENVKFNFDNKILHLNVCLKNSCDLVNDTFVNI